MKKVKSHFSLRDRNLHTSCKIYKGAWTCRETYITLVRTQSTDNKSEAAKYLADNKEHSFLWNILLSSPKDNRRRKKLETFFIAKLKPLLNIQEDSNMLTLFRNGLT